MLLGFFVFGFVFMKTTERSAGIIAIAGLAVNAVPLLYFLLNRRHLQTPFIEIVFFATAAIWLLWGSWMLALLMVVFSLFSFFATKKLQIVFDDEGILYPSFPEKKYAWVAVTQVIWKDDILTIDMKDNHLLQFNIDKNFAAKFDGDSFNKWCATHLSSH